MRRVYKIYIAITILAILSLFFIRGPGVGEDIGIALSIAGILYAILVGFFLSNEWSRVDNIREAVLEETSFYEMCWNILKGFKDRKGVARIREALRDYCSYYITLEWIEIDRAEERFENIIKAVLAIKPKGGGEQEAKEEVFDELRDALKARAMQRVLSVPQITMWHWAILYMMSAVIIFSIYYANVSFVTMIAGMMFIPGIILIMFLLYDLDMLVYSAHETSNAPYLNVLRVIGEDLKKYLKDIEYKPYKREIPRLFRMLYGSVWAKE